MGGNARHLLYEYSQQRGQRRELATKERAKRVSVEALVVRVVAPADDEEDDRNHTCDQHPGAHQIENPPEERRPAARLRRVVHSRTHRLRIVRVRHPAGSWCWHFRLLLLPQQKAIVNWYNSANCNILNSILKIFLVGIKRL